MRFLTKKSIFFKIELQYSPPISIKNFFKNACFFNKKIEKPIFMTQLQYHPPVSGCQATPLVHGHTKNFDNPNSLEN